MRGRAYPIPIPNGGVDYSQPAYLIQPNQLSDGSNVYVDIDGLLKSRKGYTPLRSTGPGARIQGGINYQNQDLTYASVVSTLTDWYWDNGASWTKITDPANPQSGSAADPARFTVFSQGGDWYACGVNNKNPVRTWKVGDANYSTPASAPSGRDILTLGSRLVVFNTIESGTRYPRRARWSSFEDRTTWGAGNYNDMLDAADFIVGARPLGSLSAAVYGASSIDIIQSNPGGDDASAFTTETLFAAQNYAGPISSAAIVQAEGADYYLASNGHVYQFNGIAPVDISGPICPEILAQINFSTATRCHGIYLPMKRLLVFFFPTLSAGNDCMAAAVFDLTRGVWLPLWDFIEAITASWQGVYSTALTYANCTFTYQTIPYSYDNVPNAAQIASFIGTSAGQVNAFFQASTDNGNSIAWSAYGPIFSPDPSKQIALDRAEVYLNPTTQQEFLTFQWDGYGSPFQPFTPIVAIGADISATNWINQMIQPGALNPNNMYANFIRMSVFSSASFGGFAFGGGVLYFTSQDKGDYSVTAISS